MKNSEKRMERDRIESSRKEKNFCDDDCFEILAVKVCAGSSLQEEENRE